MMYRVPINYLLWSCSPSYLVTLQALEQGLDGVILKVEDMDDIIKLKVCLSQLFEISLVLNY